jgi:hypothetical protein
MMTGNEVDDQELDLTSVETAPWPPAAKPD